MHSLSPIPDSRSIALMKPNTKRSLGLVFCLLMPTEFVLGQTPDRLSRTWPGPDIALIKNLLNENPNPNRTAKPRDAVVKFTPVGNSGVARNLAEAFGRNSQEVSVLKQAFDDMKSL